MKQIVILGLVPRIHVFLHVGSKGVDARDKPDKPEHDGLDIGQT
jgi:hypothetical protein